MHFVRGDEKTRENQPLFDFANPLLVAPRRCRRMSSFYSFQLCTPLLPRTSMTSNSNNRCYILPENPLFSKSASCKPRRTHNLTIGPQALLSNKNKSALVEAPPSQNPKKKRFSKSRLLRRLNTAQDSRWTHKINGSVHLLSSVAILLFGITKQIQVHEWILPENVFALTLFTAWGLSSSVMATSGAVMANRYRALHKSDRNAFLGSSSSILVNVWISWWASPYFPNILEPRVISFFLLTPLLAYNIYNVYTTARDADAIIVGKRDEKARMNYLQSPFPSLLWWRDFFVYIYPILYGLPFYVITLIQPLILHSSVVALGTNGSTFFAMIFYINIAGALNAGLGNFAVTLRDKDIISRTSEMTIISSQAILTSAFITFMMFNLPSFNLNLS